MALRLMLAACLCAWTLACDDTTRTGDAISESWDNAPEISLVEFVASGLEGCACSDPDYEAIALGDEGPIAAALRGALGTHRLWRRSGLPVLVLDTTVPTSGRYYGTQFAGDLEGRISEEQWDEVVPLFNEFSHAGSVARSLRFEVGVPGAEVRTQQQLDEDSDRESRQSCGQIGFWAPAFSKDRTKALVRAWVAPSIHGSSAMFFLRRDRKGMWFVEWATQAHYL